MVKEEQKHKIQPVIFDTDIIIFHFKGSSKAAEFIQSIPYQHRRLPVIVWMELIQGARNKAELRIIEKFIDSNFSDIIPITEIISMKAFYLLEFYALSHGLRVIDAFIASSALVQDCFLATMNKKHYQFIKGLNLLPVNL